MLYLDEGQTEVETPTKILFSMAWFIYISSKTRISDIFRSVYGRWRDVSSLYILPPFQIVSRFGFSRYIVSTHNMYLGANKAMYLEKSNQFTIWNEQSNLVFLLRIQLKGKNLWVRSHYEKNLKISILLFCLRTTNLLLSPKYVIEYSPFKCESYLLDGA